MMLHTRSVTALSAAMARAAHQVIDDPRLQEDPIALPILGPFWATGMHTFNPAYGTQLAMRLRAFVVARARFAEDALARAVEAGVRQYVILGAGLDTFAYRNPFAPTGLRVFEVDHPATQDWKRERLADAGIAAPESLVFVPMDFEKQSLFDALIGAGFDAGAPAHFSWLGVTMYLEPARVRETLAQVAALSPPGSAIAMDYLTPISGKDYLHVATMAAMSNFVALAGEPWKSYFEPGELARQHKELGFARAQDLGPDAINRQYFAHRCDGLAVGQLGHLLLLEV